MMIRRRNDKAEIVAALDIGSSKVALLAAEVGPRGAKVLGKSCVEFDGVRKGMVVSILETVEAIKKARQEVEHMSGCSLAECVVAVGGPRLRGFASRAMVASKSGEIGRRDVKRVLDSVSTVALEQGTRLVNVVPCRYTVDGHPDFEDPVEMSGVRLEVDAFLFVAAGAVLDNLAKCVNRAGMRVTEFVASPLASALAVMSEEEKEVGVAVLDMGADCGHLSVWDKGKIVHCGFIEGAGNVFTRNIATGLRTSFVNAEKLKIEYSALGEDHEPVALKVPGIGRRESREVSSAVVKEIILPTAVEVFSNVHAELKKTGLEDLLSGGMILTGGGAMLAGMPTLADDVLNLPVRLGAPSGVNGFSSFIEHPNMSCVYGLLIYAAMRLRADVPPAMRPLRVQGQKRGFFMRLRRAASLLL